MLIEKIIIIFQQTSMLLPIFTGIIQTVPSNIPPNTNQSIMTNIGNRLNLNNKNNITLIVFNDIYPKSFKNIIKTISFNISSLQEPVKPYSQMFVVKDQDGNPVPYFRYKIITGDGQIIHGVTNSKGETIRIRTSRNHVKVDIYKDNKKK